MSYFSCCRPSKCTSGTLGAQEMICPATEELSRPGGNFASPSLAGSSAAVYTASPVGNDHILAVFECRWHNTAAGAGKPGPAGSEHWDRA